MRTLSSLLALTLILPALRGEHDWPQFRGPGARGVSAQEGLPERWSATENVAWSVELPGVGWSSPIVWGDRVFVTTALSSGDEPQPQRGLYMGVSKRSESEHAFLVLCFDLASGEMLWDRAAHEGVPPHSIHGKNTYASETPVTDGERVYAYFGNVGLFALDMQGEPLWERRWEPADTRFGWGTAASPAVHAGRLYVVSDNEKASWLEALDAKTGETLWRKEREEKSNWSTPFVWQNEKRTELVTPGTGTVRSYGLDGKVLWTLKGMSGITSATPYASHGLVYVTSGFVMSKERPIYAIRPGASGDVSLEAGSTANEFVAWSHPQGAPYIPSTIVVGERLYSLLDNGVLACYDAETGATIYDKKRVRAGSGYSASPWSYGNKLFFLDEDGMTTVVPAGEEFAVERENDLGEMCMATPAIGEGSLLIRTLTRLYCIRAGKEG